MEEGGGDLLTPRGLILGIFNIFLFFRFGISFAFLLLLLFVVEKPEALTYSPLIFSENRFEGGKLAEIRQILNTLWVKNICGYRV